MWNELVTSALIGTERRAFTLDDLPEELREIAAQLEGQDSERVLLTLAGTLALYRRAGQAPQIDQTPLPDPCPPDTQPFCSPRAGQILQQILVLGNHAQHLPEWIEAAYNAHQRITPEYLPRFLVAFEKKSTLPDHFYDVIGARGRWLARQNPAWAYAVLPESDAEWETANINARIYVLRQLRATDPAHARALLEAVWSSEKAETRAALLSTYEIGLNLDDEPLLEKALDERAEAVCKAAAWFLAKLPGSAYQERMIARAQPLIQITRKHKKLVIDLTLPDAPDKEAIRDGIPTEPPLVTKQTTSKYWLWSAVAARLPAAFWLNGDWSAHELVQALQNDPEWSEALLDMIALVAEREQHNQLAEALLDAQLSREAEVLALSVVRQAEYEAYIFHALDRMRHTETETVLTWLRKLASLNYNDPWGQQMTLAVISLLREVAPKLSAAAISMLVLNFPIFATQFAPSCISDLQALAEVETQNQYLWTYNVKRAVEILEFRQKMLKEFSR